MTFGVEARVPYLSHHLVEFAFRLPLAALYRDGWTKRVLRDAFADTLPHSVAWRRDKIGFEPPEERWFRAELGAVFRELLAEPDAEVFRRFVDYDATRTAWQKFEQGDSYGNHFWRILNLHLWLRHFLTGAPATAAVG